MNHDGLIYQYFALTSLDPLNNTFEFDRVDSGDCEFKFPVLSEHPGQTQHFPGLLGFLWLDRKGMTHSGLAWC